MGAFSCGLHLNGSHEIKVNVSQGRADGQLICWVSVDGLNIFCNSLAGAEGIASAIRQAAAAPREYADLSQRSQDGELEQAREANSK